jgi:hypothetical protein
MARLDETALWDDNLRERFVVFYKLL